MFLTNTCIEQMRVLIWSMRRISKSGEIPKAFSYQAENHWTLAALYLEKCDWFLQLRTI